MEKKRNFILSTLFIIMITAILSIILTPLISAAYGSGLYGIDLGEGVRQIIDQVILFGTPLFEIILGDYSGSEFFFYKILFLGLLFIIIFAILDRIPLFEGNPGISKLVAAIVSIIAIRFISTNDLIYGLLLPYGTLGVVITLVVPFIILSYGIFQMNLGGLGRRIAWVITGVVFLVLWLYNSDKVDPMANWIYTGLMIALIFMFIFDKRISLYLSGLEGKRADQAVIDERIALLEGKKNEIRAYAGPVLSREQNLTIARYETQIKKLRARRTHFI